MDTTTTTNKTKTKTKTITLTVSADGFTWTPITTPEENKIDVYKGDTINLQQLAPTPPLSVTVTAKDPNGDATALFGTATPDVPSHHVIGINKGVFVLKSGCHSATIRVAPGQRNIIPDPVPNPRK